MRIQEDPKGYLKIWEKPLPNSLYFIPADTAKSGDWCSASVMHWGRNEQVATAHGHFEPDEWGRILFKLGAYYNFSLIIPENNGIGAGSVASLKMLNYPQLFTTKNLAKSDSGATSVEIDYGFNTNTRTRPLIIASGQRAIRERSVIIRDINYIIEMQGFQRNKDGRYEAASDERGVVNDDRVMEFCIGQYFYQTNPIPEFAGFQTVNPIAMPDNAGIPNQSGASGSNEGFDDFTR